MSQSHLFCLISVDRSRTLLGKDNSDQEIDAALRAFSTQGNRSIGAPAPKAKTNLTATWLAKHGKETRQMLIDHLSHKLPTSRRISVIEDHVQTFLCRLVEKDTLAPHLEAGKNIQPSVLRIWAFQSACTEMRGWGVDASLRKSRGAKTNRDRMADSGALPQVVIQSPEPVIERRFEVENGEVVSDFHDPNARSAEDEMIASETYDQALEFLRNGGNGRYAALLGSLLDDKGKLLAKDATSRAKMAKRLSRLRDLLREENLISD